VINLKISGHQKWDGKSTLFGIYRPCRVSSATPGSNKCSSNLPVVGTWPILRCCGNIRGRCWRLCWQYKIVVQFTVQSIRERTALRRDGFGVVAWWNKHLCTMDPEWVYATVLTAGSYNSCMHSRST